MIVPDSKDTSMIVQQECFENCFPKKRRSDPGFRVVRLPDKINRYYQPLLEGPEH